MTTYRLRATVVAESSDVYAERVQSEYGFTLEGLNESERVVVTRAIGSTYTASENDTAFESVAQRFDSHRAVERTPIGGNWVVRYRGTVYWAELRFGAFSIGRSA